MGVGLEKDYYIFEALNIPEGYAQKAQKVYDGEEEDDNLRLIAYDMLFGDDYIYDGESPVTESDMRRGVDIISITDIKNESGHIVVTGENFNEFSVVYDGDDSLDTVYVDHNKLMVENVDDIKQGDSITVKQVDESKHILSSTDCFIYK